MLCHERIVHANERLKNVARDVFIAQGLLLAMFGVPLTAYFNKVWRYRFKVASVRRFNAIECRQPRGIGLSTKLLAGRV